MAVPKRKTSRSVTKQRRTHKKIAPVSLINCPDCSEKKLPHVVCPKCGMLRGEQIVEVNN